MSVSADEWKTELSRLPTKERAELARFLIDSLDRQTDADADEAWEAELSRRAEGIRSGKAQGKPVDEAMTELRGKHS